MMHLTAQWLGVTTDKHDAEELMQEDDRPTTDRVMCSENKQ